ncbi:hypothetical protein BACCELL_02236 [Bacteroides cellulosilyticus DSM 14838]|uniref:Uncharacterized protein n=1 Tax=Bacteroides cellulosilyticus DSM 14838 TaxID=537012 RepID=E2ND77_9BACE|nr:hypothetical protein BACCELL_02236 [Bacteroides cellulosilyticus DSM 14838]
MLLLLNNLSLIPKSPSPKPFFPQSLRGFFCFFPEYSYFCCTKQTKKHSICNANLLCMWCGYIVPAVP